MSYCGKEGIIKKHIVSVVLLLIMGFISCYDGLQDVYEEGRVYNLRDRGPAGGWIFYINPNYKADGWRYLEAAPEDQSVSAAWSNIGGAYVSNGSVLPAAIGSGKANTEAIIAQAGHVESAAKVCRNYRGGGYNDWFLPSKDEFNQMYCNLWLLGVGNFHAVNGQYYWSSTDWSESSAYAQQYTDGLQAHNPKLGSDWVRAIRAF